MSTSFFFICPIPLSVVESQWWLDRHAIHTDSPDTANPQIQKGRQIQSQWQRKLQHEDNDEDKDKDKHNICNVNIFCQHLTPAKQLVLVKTNKEGWKQSIVLHIFGKLVKHSLFGSGYILYDLARVATLNFRQIATVWTDKL